MRDRGIVKGPEHVHERVGISVSRHVDQRLRATGSARNRQVGKFHGCRYPLFRVVHRGEPVESPVGNLGHANRGLALAVCAPRGLLEAGHELKERGLAAGTRSYERRSEHEKPRILTRWWQGAGASDNRSARSDTGLHGPARRSGVAASRAYDRWGDGKANI